MATDTRHPATATASAGAVLAVGAWLKNTACWLPADGRAPRWSAVHGDLSDPAACEALAASLNALRDQAGAPPVAIAHDLHPDFFSTRLALQRAQAWGVPAIAVQHHHAHIAAVVAEHALREPVIGLALDGVGLGSDGQAWGGELLRLDADGGWQRLGHLWPLALPGGDVAAREPWRMAAAALHALGRAEHIATRWPASQVSAARARGVAQMLAANLNCPPTSSTGRWFDAAAGALGLSTHQAHEAEAAIALEHSAQRGLAQPGAEPSAADIPRAAPGQPLDLRPLLARLLFNTAATPKAVDTAAAWFHLALADGLADWAARAAAEHGLRTVCLGGGCFFNSVLTTRLTARLQQHGLNVHRPQRVNCGDAGLALGQAWVAQRLLAQPHHHSPEKAAACASPFQPA
ncbi:MAG: hypothetical protein RJA98_4028 [Pseudomonadota bacterium]